MADIAELIAATRRNGVEVWIGGGASEDQVAILARALEVSLPPSYVDFLKAYGAISIGDHVVSGILENNALDETGGSVRGDTLEFREHEGFPKGFVVVGRHEDGAYCLDMNSQLPNGECPVVNFEFGSAQHRKPVASNFEDWLRRFRLEASAR